MKKVHLQTQKTISTTLKVGGRLLVTLLFTTFNNLAHAELSLGALAGVVDYTTKIRGDAVYSFGGPGGYYQYPGDINSKNFAGGLFLRYLHPVPSRFSLGAETGYVFLNRNVTRLRADDLLPLPTAVENFSSKSNGLVIANLIARWMVVPAISFGVFAGPAWLDTEYTANDFADNVVRKVGNRNQFTGDVGAEANWDFSPNWSAGMRFDYIFNTKNRTVARFGSFGDPLFFNTIAKSSLTMASATLRYLIPGT